MGYGDKNFWPDRAHQLGGGGSDRGGIFRPTLAPVFSAGVGAVPKRSSVPVHPRWPPIKGKNIGQKKLIHAEILGPEIGF
jgi:hypothetical protein